MNKGKNHHSFKDRTGNIFENSQGYKIKIIKYEKWNKVTIQFCDGTIIDGVQISNLKKGTVTNPNHLSYYGIACIGVGKYNSQSVGYSNWSGMLNRCYNLKIQEKQPSYKGCYIDKQWLNFQNFAEWFENNWNPETMQGWQLDKDILVKGNKIYSPETCCFVPQEINKLFIKSNKTRGKYPIGVRRYGNYFQARILKYNVSKSLGAFLTPEEAFQAYKIGKEAHIKEVADLWREKISECCYEAMYNWVVEIKD